MKTAFAMAQAYHFGPSSISGPLLRQLPAASSRRCRYDSVDWRAFGAVSFVVDKYPSSVSQAFVCSVTMCLSLWMWGQIVLHLSIGENERACGIFELLS
jgi:hypothetical protein